MEKKEYNKVKTYLEKHFANKYLFHRISMEILKSEERLHKNRAIIFWAIISQLWLVAGFITDDLVAYVIAAIFILFMAISAFFDK